MAGSIAGPYAVLSMVEELLQDNLGTYLAAVEADAGAHYTGPTLAAPSTSTGYAWGHAVVPQDRSNGIQLYIDDTDPRLMLFKANGANEETHNVVVRWYYHARRDYQAKQALLMGRAVSKLLNEKWHSYTPGTGRPDPCVIELRASVDYTGNSLNLAELGVPGQRGIGNATGTQIEAFDVLVTIKQKSEHVTQ